METETQEVMSTYSKGRKKEKETQEVLSAIGNAYCSLKRQGKNHKQNRECLLLTTETKQAPH